MLKRLAVQNFTVFGDAEFCFSRGLNVIIGENATGKTHLMKLAYAVVAASAEQARQAEPAQPTKAAVQRVVADKLVGVFRPDSLGRLVKRRQGRERCDVSICFENPRLDTTFSFSTNSRSEVTVDQLPGEWVPKSPVFLPTRELLSLYPGFVSLYEGRYLEFEETWRDTCALLGEPALKGPREDAVASLVAPLERAMGGNVVLDTNGRFYLHMPGQARLEIPLVAEGIRKLAMLARLIATGTLLDHGLLFWDEPEASLNPALIRDVAAAILKLSRSGLQVIIATHSLFLMRELTILLGEEHLLVPEDHFVGLAATTTGLQIEQGHSIEEISVIRSLDEAIEQSDRYLEMVEPDE